MATLVIPWYRSSSDRHNAELLSALCANLRAPGVDRVLLVSEFEPPPISDARLEFVSSRWRPGFWDLFELVRDEGPFAIVNADCCVIDLRHLSQLTPDESLWVSRWEPAGRARYRCARYGADLFGFAAVPDRIAGHVGSPGEYAGDTRLGEALDGAGYRVHNLPCAVPIIHFHSDRPELEELQRPGLGRPCRYHCSPSGAHPSPLWREPLTDFQQRAPAADYPEPHASG